MGTKGDGHSGEVDWLADGLSAYLAPLIAGLMKQGSAGTGVPAIARALWSKLGPKIEKSPRLKESAEDLAQGPADPDLLAIFGIRLRRLLYSDSGLAASLLEAAGPRQEEILGEHGACRCGLPGGDDPVMDRIEAVYRLRSGRPPDEVARAVGMSVEQVFRLNRRFCAAGVAGLLSDTDTGHWLARLGRDDPVLRRLDMIDLVRSGTPAAVVAREYDALPEYVQMVHERFSRGGMAGMLTDEERERLWSLTPKTIRVASYNLHGLHCGADQTQRLKNIGWAFARLDVHAAALQEVLSGGEVEDTGVQISRWASKMTGYNYRPFFAYCHPFMEKYPEGVSVSVRCAPEATKTIDLTGLPRGLKPSLTRNALAVTTEVFGRKVVFVSVHLDHTRDPAVRLAQAEKLVAEVEADAPPGACLILAGDFNDLEDSPAIHFLLSAGYTDTYRALHGDAGNTYPAGGPQMRIDYIFVKGHAGVAASGLLPDDPDLSDHIGVYAEIR